MAEHRASCQCGTLRIVATGDPEFTVVCNCRACQKRTGAPFGVGVYFRKTDVGIEGPASRWERVAESGRLLEHLFCPTCGVTIAWTLEMRPDHIGVTLGNFDTPAPTPVRAIWMNEKHDWVRFPDDWPTYPQGSPS